MAVVAARAEPQSERRSRSVYCIELGILNNMPGPALEMYNAPSPPVAVLPEIVLPLSVSESVL